MAKQFVTGWKEIDAALAKVPANVQRRVIANTLKTGTKRIAAIAKENVQSSPSVATQKLLNGIGVKAGKRSQTMVQSLVCTKGAPHANLVEYGTKRMPAEPFLRPAGYGNKELIRSMMLDDIAEAIKKTTTRWKFEKKATAAAKRAERRTKRFTKKISKRAKKATKRFKKTKKNLSKRFNKTRKAVIKKYQRTKKNLAKQRKTRSKRRRAKPK